MSLLFVRFVVRALFLSLYFSDKLNLRIEEMSRQTPANGFFSHVCYYFCLSLLSFYATSARFMESIHTNTHFQMYETTESTQHRTHTDRDRHLETMFGGSKVGK